MLKDIILYIPRKIYAHFDYIHKLEKENTELNILLVKHKRLLKRIVSECDYNTQINNYSNGYSGLKKNKRASPNVPPRTKLTLDSLFQLPFTILT